jgi:O-acetyl-ADP-ribose deacetylase (regulator of RNase III)/predicted RNA-binding Zn-ribbon protein involved in translation (DUF1610 family)
MMPLTRFVQRRRWRREEARNVQSLRGYRTPIQVCPRGCEHHELARRDVIARTRMSGRAALHVAYTFETTNCPRCGARLIRRCARCGNEIFAPVADRCTFCGLPQPWAAERRAGAERTSLRLWRPGDVEEVGSLRHANDPARLLYATKERGKLYAIEGDITQLAVDAIVSDDDVDGQMWAQVAGAIKKAAGEGVERLAQEGKPFRLGQAWWTSPGALQHLRGIIHVASLSRNGATREETVHDCLVGALQLAAQRGYSSIGIAAIGSGPDAIPLKTWYRLFGKIAIAHLHDPHPRAEAPALSIVLVLFQPESFEAELQALRQAIWDEWVEAGRPADGTPEFKFDDSASRLRVAWERWRLASFARN